MNNSPFKVLMSVIPGSKQEAMQIVLLADSKTLRRLADEADANQYAKHSIDQPTHRTGVDRILLEVVPENGAKSMTEYWETVANHSEDIISVSVI